MKKNTISRIYKALLICCLGILLANCEGEDGANGISGKNGINGENGTNGTNGNNGQNGVGFEELLQYGEVQLTLSGKRSDNVDFIDTNTFKFTPTELAYNSFSEANDLINFNLSRFLSIPGNPENKANINLALSIENSESEDRIINYLEIRITNYDIIFDDLTYFKMNNGRGFSSNSISTSNFSLTNYSFNKETNNLVFSFSLDIDSDSNITGNELSVQGEVNVTLLENNETIR